MGIGRPSGVPSLITMVRCFEPLVLTWLGRGGRAGEAILDALMFASWLVDSAW